MGSAGERLAELAERYADDDSHGYSQKPPSGRWGPDYDCSSFVYQLAQEAGFDVGAGNGVRYTGTLAEDFKRAGFQILPFANVGLGELEVGDILLNLALHAEVYVGEGQSVGAMSSETGGYVGKAGDQTGSEIEKHPVYEFDKGWDYVVRPPQEEEEDDPPEEGGEGGSEMPSYPNGGWQGRNTWNPNYSQGYRNYPQMEYQQSGYPQNYQQAYPQGNLGQMNGYASAMQGGQMNPQGRQQLAQASGIEEVNGIFVSPGTTLPIFDWNNQHLFLKSADMDGVPSIRAFHLEECTEEFPQFRGMGGMGQGGQAVTRQEFEQLKEMIASVQSAVMGSSDGSQQGESAKQANNRGTRTS